MPPAILSEEAYVDGNIELDKELHELKREKANIFARYHYFTKRR